MQGDGYQYSRSTSPHTKYEKFEGLTVNHAAEVDWISELLEAFIVL